MIGKFNVEIKLHASTHLTGECNCYTSRDGISLDEVDEFKDIITSTEFLAKDIYQRICDRLKKDFNEDYQTLHKLKITLTESNVAWASFEKKIDK